MEKYSMEYIGGFFDGEGSMGFMKSNRNHPFISVGMVKTPETDELLQEMLKLFGGHIRFKPKEYWTKFGLNAQDQIQWRIDDNASILVAAQKLLPFLKLKRGACERVIAFYTKTL